jgi:hypothetical protein
MGRIIWALLIGGALLATPQVREWLAPRAQPLLNPVYEWSAHSRVKEIARLLETRRSAAKPLPTTRTFSAFLKEEFVREDATLDPWGTPLYLRKQRGALVVGSAGRDGEAATADDITASVATGRD